MIQHVILVVSVLMAGDIPDLKHRIEIRSGDVEICWRQAQDWVKRPPPAVPGAIGMGALCAVYVDDQAPDEDDDDDR